VVTFTPFDETNVFNSPEQGIMVPPGDYKVSLSKFEDGIFTELVPPVSFRIEALNLQSMPITDRNALIDFSKKVQELFRVSRGTNEYSKELINKLKYMKEAAIQKSYANALIIKNMVELERRLSTVDRKLNGDATLLRREFESPTSIHDRMNTIMTGLITTTTAPTTTFINSYNEAAKAFTPIYNEIKLIDSDIKKLEQELEQSGASYTPGRLPDWKL